MMKKSRFSFLALLFSGVLLMAGCAMTSQPPATLYDLGPLSSMPTERTLTPEIPPLVIFRVQSPEWLNNSMMYYRLGHVNEQQTRFYTQSRWNMSPPKLFRERLRARIAAAGGELGGERSRDREQLRIIVHVEDFSQYFYDDSNSEARISVRATLLDRDGAVSQKVFFQAAPAKTPDAPGGAQALSVATDALITEMFYWIVEACQSPRS